MKIKKTKQMRLDELIKYIFDNDIKDTVFSSNINISIEPYYKHSNKVYVHGNGTISLGMDKMNTITARDCYSVEIEEEVNDETEFEELQVVINSSGDLEILVPSDIHTIKEVLDADDEFQEVFSIYATTNGYPALIWSHDTGIHQKE